MQIKNISFLNVDDFSRDQVELSRRALGTLVVREDMQAIDLARAVDALGTQARVIVLVDANDVVSGLFVPEEFMERLQNLGGIQVDSLTEALTILETDPTEQIRNFQSEINLERPELVWCSTGDHFSIDPCPEHR